MSVHSRRASGSSSRYSSAESASASRSTSIEGSSLTSSANACLPPSHRLRVAVPAHVLGRVLGLDDPVHEQHRRPGALRGDRDAHQVGADRHPLLAGLVLVELGLVDLVADVDDVAVPGLVQDRGARDQVLDAVGGEAAGVLLLLEQRLLRDLELGRVLGVEVEAVDQVGLADRLLEVVEDEHPPVAVGVEQVVPGAGHPRDLVVAPGDPGRVVGVGNRELVVADPTRGCRRRSRRCRCCAAGRGRSAPAGPRR